MRRALAFVSLVVCGCVGAQVALSARVQVTRANANVRISPRMDAEIITMLTRDNEVTADSVGTTWTRVALANGQSGYIAARLLQTPHPFVPRRPLLMVLGSLSLISCFALFARRQPAPEVRRVIAPRSTDIRTPLPT